MRYGELVSYTGETRPLKVDLLIVISSFNGYGLVERHLELLSRQSYQKFNVLLVLGVPFDDARLEGHLRKKKYSFGVIIAKENERRGCSGAFFTGQKYALEKNYGYVIMADDDCMPVDGKLVGELYARRSAGYVVPTTVFVEGSYRKKGFSAGPTQYSLYSTDVFRKYGLYYLPLFQGADDAEYMERVRERPVRIQNKTEHPYIAGMRLFSMLDRSLLFLHQGLIIIKSPPATLYNLAQHSFLACCSLLFLPPYGRRAYAEMKRLLFTHAYGKAAEEGLKTGYRDFVANGLPPGKFVCVNDTDAGYMDRGAWGKLSETIGAARFFRQDVAIEKTYSFVRGFAIAAFAKRLYVKVGNGEYLLMADNGPLALHLARMAAFAVFLPIDALVSGIVFLPMKAALQPRTLGYGLP